MPRHPNGNHQAEGLHKRRKTPPKGTEQRIDDIHTQALGAKTVQTSVHTIDLQLLEAMGTGERKHMNHFHQPGGKSFRVLAEVAVALLHAAPEIPGKTDSQGCGQHKEKKQARLPGRGDADRKHQAHRAGRDKIRSHLNQALHGFHIAHELGLQRTGRLAVKKSHG